MGVFSIMGDIMSTVGGSLEYRGGRSVQWGCHPFLEYRGGYQDTCEDIRVLWTCSVPWKYSNNKGSPQDTTTCIMICLTVLNIPHGTHDIPDDTEHLHSTHDILHIYHDILMVLNIPHGNQDIPHGAEHTLYMVILLRSRRSN